MKFEFQAGRLILQGLSSPNFTVHLDGRTDLAAEPVAGSAYMVTLPRHVLDARPHSLVVTENGADTRHEFRSQYEASVVVSEAGITGYVRDRLHPDVPVLLDLDLDRTARDIITADEAHADAPEGTRCGFSVAWPLSAHDRDAHILGLRVRGTDHYPFGRYLININARAVQEALAGSLDDPDLTEALRACLKAQALGAARDRELLRDPVGLPSVWRIEGPGHRELHSTVTDVIVPVYRGRDETMACLDSVVAARVSSRINLVVILDASPDPELVRAVRLHASQHGYQLLENPENLGFVRTVNRGMALNPDHDVVLLNADTRVGDGWIDRLRHAAYSAPRIGTATAMSNNATICSVPNITGMEGIPYGLSFADMVELCAGENHGLTVDLPTAHGFCMYIRRECLQQTGLFDADKFGRGYGEENDFSLRAAALGWRHVAACDVFVEHKGGVSFDGKAELVARNLEVLALDYPDYQAQVHRFLSRDPMASARNRLQTAVWRDRHIVVIFSLATGGGVDTNINAVAGRLKDEGYRVILAQRVEREHYRYALREWGTKAETLYPACVGLNGMLTDVLRLKPAFVHIHHLIDIEDGVDQFLRTSGLPYFVTLHDYFYLCPRVTLLDDGGEYCDLPSERACNTCVKRGGVHRDLNPALKDKASDIVQWRDKWRALLSGARKVIAPSEAAAAMYRRLMSDLPIQVLPHMGPDHPSIAQESVAAPSEIRVALIGGIGQHKGFNQVISLLRWAEKREPDLKFVLIGFSDHIEQIRAFPNLEDTGPYTEKTLPERIARSGCRVALFLSPWPETYTYTLSEALFNGLTPVTLDIGAPAERVRALGCGEVVPVDAPHSRLIEAIRMAARTKVVAGSYSEGRYGTLKGDYYGVDSLPTSEVADSVMLAGGEGFYEDGWARRQVRLRFAARSTVNRLRLDVYIPEEFGLQKAHIFVGGEDYGLIDIPAVQALRRLDVVTRPMSGLIDVDIRFAFLNGLAAPDERFVAARLVAANFERNDEPIAPEAATAPVRVRLRSSPDLVLDDVDAIDESGGLEAIYADVTRYQLMARAPGLLTSAKALARDALWSARIARRKGVKSAAKAFLAMRTLRQSSFDETFYRHQLAQTPRAGMDPVNHYVVFGDREGFDPAPGFSTEFYLNAHEDVAVAGANPFYHFLKSGNRENRRVEPSQKIGLFLQMQSERRDLPDSGLHRALRLGHSTPPLTAHGDTAQSGWPRRDHGADAARGKFDIRPDDSVIAEAEAGRAFMKAYGLDGDRADFRAAVKAINDRPRPSISDRPEVSIIVPVFNQLSYTLNCLHALLAHHSRHPFEVLIGDDASTDDSADWLHRIAGAIHVRHASNGGFIENCNLTAERAQGKYVVLLNNDTRVCEGWLDELVATFSRFPNVGMAGSKLFYPDGSLQEAGGIVWKDGSAWNYGRNDDPNLPEYCYARAVDYVSGASIILPRDQWQAMKGFDTHYRPAYYEDTDLAFRLQAAGKQVIMQPLSRVIHYEGKSSGTETSGGIKAYQVINREKFFERWQGVLANHRANGEDPWRERDRGLKKRVLILDACNPTPTRDAGSKATVDVIRCYQSMGYHVTFVPEDNFLFERAEVAALQSIGIECLYAPFASNLAAVLQRQGAVYDVVHLIRPNVAQKSIDSVKKFLPKARIVYMAADLHFLRMQRQALTENNPDLLEEAEVMKARELAVVSACDAALVHSDIERDILADEIPSARVEILPLVEAVVESISPYFLRKDIVFVGGFNHPPNVDAANWLIDEIWPRLAPHMPEARLVIVGSNPSDALRARANDRIEITGEVPTLGPSFDRARLSVAPLRFGAGVKGKVVASLAHGVPVVGTSIAAEGLPLEIGHTFFMENDVDGLVQEIRRVYELPTREWNRISLHAQDYVSANHAPESARRALEVVLS